MGSTPHSTLPVRHCTRRTFLQRTAVLGLSQLLAGCASESSPLNIWPLTDTVPSALASRFRRQLGRSTPLHFSPQDSLDALFKQLVAWQKPPQTGDRGLSIPFLSQKVSPVGDLVMLGDYWLSAAIEGKLLQDLDTDILSPLSRDPIDWAQLVCRDDRLWALPYRWGTLVIAYRSDKFESLGWTPTDWTDLWKPELQGRISFPDRARIAIGTALKSLGLSYNTTDLDAIPELPQRLEQLQSQVKLYSSDAYLPPLLLGDIWVAVGWSADVLALPQYGRTIGAIVPRSGTVLWADLWVRPLGADGSSDAWRQWVEFCWQPDIATRLSLLSAGASPSLAGKEENDRPAALQNRPVLLPDRDILRRSEFLHPLPPEAIVQYEERWKEMRSPTLR